MALSERLLLTLAVLAAYALFCWYHWRRRQRVPDSGAHAAGGVLVGYASQSGRAAELAQRTAAALSQRAQVLLLPLNQINPEVLQGVDRALFVASTYGEGEPPDNAARFAHHYLDARPALDLSHLEYAVLALGDRAYRHFCGFGHRLHQGLAAMGARALDGVLEVTAEDLRDESPVWARWQEQLTSLGGTNTSVPAPGFKRWRLRQRRQLNPGSDAAPLFHLQLTPPQAGGERWHAGDIVEILSRNCPEYCERLLAQLRLDGATPITLASTTAPLRDWLAGQQLPSSTPDPVTDPLRWLQTLAPLPARQYSIASAPETGALDLVIRQRQLPAGGLGVASGWLTAHAPADAEFELRIRANPNFHPPESGRDLLLIGAGSGIAGLRGLLQARQGGCGRNWLIFGERSPDSDRPFADEITAWQAGGHLQRVDLCFSQAPLAPHYVQDALLQARDEVRAWIAAGAAVYICGSRQGMAAGVHEALEQILGQDGLARLCDAELYRRDVY